MSRKYKNKYRIDSIRLQNWDYRWAGVYFITICTKNREHYFGEIENGNMILSHVGVLADVLWHQIKHHAKNIELGAFVVMPNHIHGVVILTGDDGDTNNDTGTTHTVETGHALSLQQPSQSKHTPPTSHQTIGQQRFQHIGNNSVSSIIGSYKSAVTKHARRLGYTLEWQTRFYDHIIRDDIVFQKISNYILNNPAHWKEDNFFDMG